MVLAENVYYDVYHRIWHSSGSKCNQPTAIGASKYHTIGHILGQSLRLLLFICLDRSPL